MVIVRTFSLPARVTLGTGLGGGGGTLGHVSDGDVVSTAADDDHRRIVIIGGFTAATTMCAQGK